MQLKPRHAWHPQIREQAGGPRTVTGFQKSRRTFEFRRHEAERSNKGGNGLASRLIVVNDRHEWLAVQWLLRRSPLLRRAQRARRPLPGGMIPPVTSFVSEPGCGNYTKV